MDKHTDIDEQEDVVVIEERDKRTYVYLALAGVLGLALGGLIGSSITTNKWQKSYSQLEEKYQQLNEDKTQLVETVELKVAEVDAEVETKIQRALDEQNSQHQEQLNQFQEKYKKLESENKLLQAKLNDEKEKLVEVAQSNSKLNRQADMQATMFERSRELFQRELKIKQELEALEKEKQTITPKLKLLKSDCDAYLEGKSWDAKSDACDKQDAANSRISQIDQMIQVHRMDLEQIKVLTEGIGL
ncbi:chromosome partitioning protein ParA [Vibrio aestuarianus]|uniref:Chromosome partitioning protein ParA n=1 Tax=Vibrio aestuarianus TaxID=28171 RepID=A0A9X4J1Q6_9VIBR|nr:chromosome partitioning protein ParA [Vibrio aestuarianus]MDE1236506.1 chromosome partitioning protein ParA [Vibrio aestuarianus]MDE1247361.1 chromosome partitioning protein ParA [Vibrio aestuarianus]MDE1347792.1 chromosome partitioning protein ParA [Vibrio aestuarianus]NGZ64539.1 chromosome partitioning protein ParA [Vibrio aestuarianus subsp. cardii]CAH8211220.1 Chromosome partitioning protein ParA [Vibrio aestuarianus]